MTRAERSVIDDKIMASPTDCKLMTENQEIEDQILQCGLKLKNKVNMKLTEDKKMSHNNIWRTHRELTDGPKKSHGKIYSLLLGQ